MRFDTFPSSSYFIIDAIEINYNKTPHKMRVCIYE